MTRRDREYWLEAAEDWVRWARTPGHDAYWLYRDAFFEHVLPEPGRLTLEVGCGEGRVARDLAARGHRVVAVDLTPPLARLAKEADPDGSYLIGDAPALPFGADSFDLAVAYNSLMDVDDMPGAVREAARVLGSGGRFCICVTHPMSDVGGFTSREDDAPFVIEGDYLSGGPFEGTFERDGLSITFKGWTHPIEAYFACLEDAGFVVERLREPKIPGGAGRDRHGEGRRRRIPMFLHLRARLL